MLNAQNLDSLNAIAQDPDQLEIWLASFAGTSGIDTSAMQDALVALAHTEDSLRAIASNEYQVNSLMLAYGAMLAVEGTSQGFSDRVSHLRDTLALLSAEHQEPATACTVWGQGERP